MAAQTDSQEVVLDVEGMTCASCVQKIERSLSQLEGVEDAVVNLATRTATVRTSSPDVGALISAVTHTGYGARPHTAERSADEEYRTYRRRFIAAALLTIPVLALTFVVPDLPPPRAPAGSSPPPSCSGRGGRSSAAVRAARHASTTMDTSSRSGRPQPTPIASGRSRAGRTSLLRYRGGHRDPDPARPRTRAAPAPVRPTPSAPWSSAAPRRRPSSRTAASARSRSRS